MNSYIKVKLQDPELGALLRFLGYGQTTHSANPGELRYRFTGYRKFLDPDGYPAIAPPWGTMSAIDLNSGDYLWRIPLGEYPELAARGMKNTGTENYGGPIVTAGGLVFIGATVFDRKIRAFDSRDGKLLWQHDLPLAGVAPADSRNRLIRPGNPASGAGMMARGTVAR